jgi:hypothetical protein
MAPLHTHPPALVRRLDAFAQFQAHANLYRHVLNVHVGDLEKGLAELAARVEHLREAAA